ncbi:15640_t:CDS:2 [Funneliformis geosporum]|nr:15640_t:CDS:2 [Funneliformis geosporum]
MLCSIEMLAATDWNIKNLIPYMQEWIKINNILTLLESLEKATVLLSASSYSTISVKIVDLSTLVATVLDPRIKLTLFAIGEESTNAINTVKSYFTEYHIPQPQTLFVINHNNSKKTSTQEYFHQLKKRQLENTNNIIIASIQNLDVMDTTMSHFSNS